MTAVYLENLSQVLLGLFFDNLPKFFAEVPEGCQ